MAITTCWLLPNALMVAIPTLPTATALLPTTGIVFLPLADEPEPISFSAIWSPFSQNPAIRNILVLAGKLGPIYESVQGDAQNERHDGAQ
ncbi:MAG: hypothetical protein ABGW90_00525 [Martelella sp.]